MNRFYHFIYIESMKEILIQTYSIVNQQRLKHTFRDK